MRAAFSALVFSWLLLTSVAEAGSPERYALGQIWKYKTNPQDQGSLLRIAEIEPGAMSGNPGRVYHISVIGIHSRGSNLATAIGDLPVSRESLDNSVTEVTTSTAVFPDASDGIRQWREANGGVFTVSVAEIVSYVGRMAQDGPHKQGRQYSMP